MLFGVLRSRKAYIALILSYILILLLSASFAIAGYNYLYNRQREQFTQQLTARLEQSINIAENKLESVRQAMLSTAMGVHSSAFAYKKYPFTADDYYDQAQTIKELRGISALSDCSILGLYVAGMNSVITPETRLNATDFFELELKADGFSLNEYYNILSDPGYFDVHSIVANKPRPKRLMLFSLAIPLGVGGKGAVLCGINIDDLLSSFEAGGFMNDYTISIESNSKLIYSTGEPNDGDTFSISLTGKSRLTYIATASQSILDRQLSPTRRLIAQLLIFELLGGVVFALILSKANYSPLKALLARFGGQSQSSTSGLNEFERIAEAATQLIDNNSALQSTLYQQAPLLKASILRRYFMGIGSVREEELESYGIRFVHEWLALVIIDTGAAVSNVALIGLSETLGCEAFETRENCVCVVVNADQSAIDEKLRQIYRNAQTLLHYSPAAGYASGKSSTGYSSTELFNHAVQAYEYAKAWQLIGLIDYDTISIKPAAYILTAVQEQQLIQLLTDGDPDAVCNMIEKLISSDQHEPLIHLRITAYGIITVYHRFIASWKTAAQLNEVMDAASARIAETNDPMELKELLESMAKQITTEAGRIGEDIQNNLSKRVDNLIRERFSESTLSLTDVAEELGMNASYISHVFKQQTGTGFSEALTLVRLEHAKTLLQSSLTLNAVSEQCGFTSAAYFSRVFKKQYGITPGQFRGGRE